MKNTWKHKKMIRKYFIMGSQNTTDNPSDILSLAIKHGITAFQFREKGKNALTGEAKEKLCMTLRQKCREANIPFIVNDDANLAQIVDADGIHVGQDDTSAIELRQQFPNKIIGLSISNINELQQSPIEYVDYIGAGPIFPTVSKNDAKEIVGLNWITTLRQMHPNLQIVGIGGINTTNAASVITAGANGVAVISAITKANSIAEAINNL